jgi:hypothetical protein
MNLELGNENENSRWKMKQEPESTNKFDLIKEIDQKSYSIKIAELAKDVEDLKIFMNRPYVDAKKEEEYARSKVRLDSTVDTFKKRIEQELASLRQVIEFTLKIYAHIKEVRKDISATIVELNKENTALKSENHNLKGEIHTLKIAAIEDKNKRRGFFG